MAFLLDMDGVLIRGKTMITGADVFITRLKDKGIPFMVLTNNSRFTPSDHCTRFKRMGLDIPESNIFTSALSTARFMQKQHPGGRAYVIGESGMFTALHEAGYTITQEDPDYVVVAETISYSFEVITKAVRLIERGARFIATNPDVTGPSEKGVEPACGAVAALITAATGKSPYFLGKPNPLMMRYALERLGAHSAETTMVGDRMDTDILAGMESGMHTILVLSGITSRKDVESFPFVPEQIFDSVADLIELMK